MLNLFTALCEDLLKGLLLKTERLILRPLKMSDADDVFEYDRQYDVVKYMYVLSVNKGEEISFEQVKTYIASVEDEWKKENPDFFEFAIQFGEEKKVIGNICLFFNEDRTEGEFGWVLNPAFQKKGFVTEAAAELMKYAFSLPEIKRLTAACDERNERSRKVMERLGMKVLLEHQFRRYPNTGEESTEMRLYIDKTGGRA